MYIGYSRSQIRIEEVKLEFIKGGVLMQGICNQSLAANLHFSIIKKQKEKQKNKQANKKHITSI